jgi:hypothetical protein
MSHNFGENSSISVRMATHLYAEVPTRMVAVPAALPDWLKALTLLGDHKTWRGAVAAVLTCAPAAALFGYPVGLGIAFAGLALAGDAASSLIKRRLRLEPGAEIPGLDQIPEALTPLLALSTPLGIGAGAVCALTVVFTLADLAAMPLRRPRPI